VSSSTTLFRIDNQLLAALPRDEYDRLFPKLELVRLPRNRILYEAGDAIHYAYFPSSGMVSLLAITEDGSTIEIGTVGREGYLGAPILHQVGITPYRVTVQLVQAVVCNLTHTVEQRMARRLIVMSDCLESDTFEVTQEQLSLILDRHRNRISAAGIVLREMGMIEIARSQLTIVNRRGLEAAACECYRIVKNAVEFVSAT
jgi:hypothetical protein